MIDKIKEKLAFEREIIDAIPLNNKDNAEKYIDIASSAYADINNLRLNVLEEMRQRKISFDNNINEASYEEYDFSNITQNFKLVNPINSPYEKLNLDVLLYKLAHYYRYDFDTLNDNILSLINIYQRAGITFSTDDFFYNNEVNLYMTKLFSLINEENNRHKVKSLFEEYYWKNPEIIKDIHLNFKSIYYKNIKKFNKYIELINNKIAKSRKELIREYQNIYTENLINKSMSKKYIIEKFKKGDYSIADYKEANINKIFKELTNETNFPINIIINYNESLKEYDSYLNFKNITDKVKEIVKEKAQSKIDSRKKLKEIERLEYKLKKQFKRYNYTDRSLINDLNNLYKEYEILYFEENLLKNIKKDSKIIDVLEFLMSFSGYYFKLRKLESEEEKVKYLKVTEELKEMELLFLKPNNNLINNLYALEDYNMDNIIIGKYKLDNLNLDFNIITKSLLEDLIHKTNILINYDNIKKIKDFDIQDIEEYLNLDSLLNKIE